MLFSAVQGVILIAPAYANNAQECIKWEDKLADYSTNKSPSVTNICNEDVEIFWCIVGDKVKPARLQCDDKTYYRSNRHLEPKQTYHNKYAFPPGSDIRFGACHGKNYTREYSGSASFSCKVDFKAKIKACEQDISKCAMTPNNTPKTFNIRCKDNKSIYGKVTTLIHGDNVVVKLKHAKGKRTIKSNLANLKNDINEGISLLCSAGIDSSESNKASKYIINSIKNKIILESTKRYIACRKSDDRINCPLILHRKQVSITGVRG
jgi:hypothetical protein